MPGTWRCWCGCAGVRKAVEIGTLAGYSGVSIVRGMLPDGVLYTIEGDPHHADVAAETFRKAGIDRARAPVAGVGAVDAAGAGGARARSTSCSSTPTRRATTSTWTGRRRTCGAGAWSAGDNAFLFGHLYTDRAAASQGQKAMRAFHQRLASSGEFRATVLPTGEGLAVGIKL